MKADATEKDRKAEAKMTKIIVNSGFGWTCLNMEKGTKIKIIPNGSQELDVIIG